MSLSLVRRRDLRRNSTDAETSLWNELRDRRMAGFKFRRRHARGPYVVDFYCAELKLAIELDGGQHWSLEAQAYDARRAGYLRRREITVLRFPTDLVFRERLAVLEEIARALGIGAPQDHARRLRHAEGLEVVVEAQHDPITVGADRLAADEVIREGEEAEDIPRE